jgi:hypothetical protein
MSKIGLLSKLQIVEVEYRSHSNRFSRGQDTIWPAITNTNWNAPVRDGMPRNA